MQKSLMVSAIDDSLALKRFAVEADDDGAAQSRSLKALSRAVRGSAFHSGQRPLPNSSVFVEFEKRTPGIFCTGPRQLYFCQIHQMLHFKERHAVVLLRAISVAYKAIEV